MPLLFVYGTLLQPGNPFADYLNRHCTFFCNGKTKGRLYDIGEYPGLILDETADYVSGSIYQLNNEAVLAQLDAYEGVGADEEQPNVYQRISLPIEIEAGDLNAWLYVYNLPVYSSPLIASGDYLEYLKHKKIPG